MEREVKGHPYSDVFSGVETAKAIVNRASSRNIEGYRNLEQLRRVAPFEILEVPTANSRTTKLDLIHNALENSQLLIIVGGDGTFNDVLHTISTNGLSDEAKLTPIWCMGGGNANDGTKAMHSKNAIKNPAYALYTARTISSYPIRFDITRPDGETITRSAGLYATLGISGLYSSDKYLNNPSFRKKLTKLEKYSPLTRKIATGYLETMLGLKALTAYKAFEIKQADGVTREVYDEVYVNSSQMAKYLGFPTKLNSREIFHYTSSNRAQFLGRNALHAVSHIHSGQLVSAYTSDDEYIRGDEQRSFYTSVDAYAQFDGEAEIVPANSRVDVSIHKQPITLLATHPDLIVGHRP